MTMKTPACMPACPAVSDCALANMAESTTLKAKGDGLVEPHVPHDALLPNEPLLRRPAEGDHLFPSGRKTSFLRDRPKAITSSLPDVVGPRDRLHFVLGLDAVSGAQLLEVRLRN